MQGRTVLTRTLDLSTFSLISLMQVSWRFWTVKLLLQPAISNKKLRSISIPLSVRSTSGWNCVPYSFFCSLAMPDIQETKIPYLQTSSSRHAQPIFDLGQFWTWGSWWAFGSSSFQGQQTRFVYHLMLRLNEQANSWIYIYVNHWSRSRKPGVFCLSTCDNISGLGDNFKSICNFVDTVSMCQQDSFFFLQAPLNT